MHHACNSVFRVADLQIRNVPDDLHRRLKARAALEGRSLSDFALAELRRSLDRPTRAEVLDRIGRRKTPDEAVNAAELIRAERDAR